MKNRRYLTILAALLCITSMTAQSYQFIKADDPNFSYVGRISFADPQAPTFTYPGVQIHTVFDGTSARMVTKLNSGYFMVELDNQEPYKIHSSEEDSVVVIAEGLKDREHRLTLTYINEGMFLRPVFYGLMLDKGKGLVRRPELPQRKIEFIGNSITCGYGIEGDGTEKKFLYETENQYYTYAALTARELQAQCLVVARSGIGIYRNCNGRRRGDAKNMQALYPYTLFGTEGELWDFKRYTPDLVCVNLGTNDTTLPGYEVTLLTSAYKRFLKTLRQKYPKATIVLLTGPIVKRKRLTDIRQAQQEAIRDAKARGDHKIYTFEFTPDDGSLGYGTHRHPSLERNKVMAEELTAYLRKLMNWN